LLYQGWTSGDEEDLLISKLEEGNSRRVYLRRISILPAMLSWSLGVCETCLSCLVLVACRIYIDIRLIDMTRRVERSEAEEDLRFLIWDLCAYRYRKNK